MPVLPSSRHLVEDLVTKDALKAQQPVAEVTPEETYKAKQREDLLNYQTQLPYINNLIDSWQSEVAEVESNRKLRNIDLSPKKLREEGKLLPDETIIPIRLVDTNITREQPAYINYLKNSPRVACFRCIPDPARNTENIESEFTRVMTYPEWDIPFQRTIDGAQANGLDYVEIVFDPSKPGQIAVEHVGKDNLYYNKDSINLQANQRLIRRYSFSYGQIEDAIYRYSFDATQAKKICDACSAIDKRERNIYIYKIFFKLDGVVMVAWFCKEYCDNWLKTPTPHYVGLQKKVTKLVPQPPITLMGITLMQQLPIQVETLEDEPLDIFPIFVFIYKESEEQKITQKKGRVFLDKHKQQAQTATATSFVNALVRASKVYGSVGQADQGDTSPPKQIESPLVNGGIYDKPVNFWGFPWPDATMLSSLQYFDTQNSQEVGQVAFAVQNRKDSRKTATEIGAAQEDQSMLTSNQVSLLSTFLRLVYSFAWRIVQNRAMNGHITFLAQPVPNLATGQITYQNDMMAISQPYDIRPSGDIDVIKRGQKLQQLKADWSVFSTTPLAGEFLKEIIRTSYPEKAAAWIQVIDIAQQMALTNPQPVPSPSGGQPQPKPQQ